MITKSAPAFSSRAIAPIRSFASSAHRDCVKTFSGIVWRVLLRNRNDDADLPAPRVRVLLSCGQPLLSVARGPGRDNIDRSERARNPPYERIPSYSFPRHLRVAN